MLDVPVIDIMTTKLVFVKPADTVLEAVKKMVEAGIGNVLVISSGKLLGIVTEKDVITKLVLKNHDPANMFCNFRSCVARLYELAAKIRGASGGAREFKRSARTRKGGKRNANQPNITGSADYRRAAKTD